MCICIHIYSAIDGIDAHMCSFTRTSVYMNRCLRCCVQVRAILGGPKGSKETAALSDDETIEKCLNEVEAALNAGLNFKGKFNSGLQVLALSCYKCNACIAAHSSTSTEDALRSTHCTNLDLPLHAALSCVQAILFFATICTAGAGLCHQAA